MQKKLGQSPPMSDRPMCITEVMFLSRQGVPQLPRLLAESSLRLALWWEPQGSIITAHWPLEVGWTWFYVMINGLYPGTWFWDMIIWYSWSSYYHNPGTWFLDHWSHLEPKATSRWTWSRSIPGGACSRRWWPGASLRCPRDGGCWDRLWRLRKTRARRIAVQALEVAERCPGCPCYFMLPSFTAIINDSFIAELDLAQEHCLDPWHNLLRWGRPDGHWHQAPCWSLGWLFWAQGSTCSDSGLCLGLRWLPFISSWEEKRRPSWKMPIYAHRMWVRRSSGFDDPGRLWSI